MKKRIFDTLPKESLTVEEHSRRTRFNVGLSQLEVLNLLQVYKEISCCWKLIRNEPTAKFAKRIIQFRGYIPYDWKSAPFEKRLIYLRLVEATTKNLLAEKLGMVEYNMAKIEWGK